MRPPPHAQRAILGAAWPPRRCPGFLSGSAEESQWPLGALRALLAEPLLDAGETTLGLLALAVARAR
jgi:hypothetical protein